MRRNGRAGQGVAVGHRLLDRQAVMQGDDRVPGAMALGVDEVPQQELAVVHPVEKGEPHRLAQQRGRVVALEEQVRFHAEQQQPRLRHDPLHEPDVLEREAGINRERGAAGERQAFAGAGADFQVGPRLQGLMQGLQHLKIAVPGKIRQAAGDGVLGQARPLLGRVPPECRDGAATVDPATTAGQPEARRPARPRYVTLDAKANAPLRCELADVITTSACGKPLWLPGSKL